MQQDHELIAKIRALKAIKPSPEWKAALKSQLFPSTILDFSSGTKHSFGLRPRFTLIDMILGRRLAFALASAAIIIAGGVFVLSKQALPGETLFGAKKLTEQISLALTPEDEKLKAELLAIKQRLDELEVLALQSESQKLALAIQEYKEISAKTARNINQKTQIITDKTLAQEIALKAQGFKQREAALEQVLATDISASQELSEAAYAFLYRSLSQDLIEKLSQASLTESQKSEFDRAKGLFEQGSYQQALEALLLLSQSNPE